MINFYSYKNKSYLASSVLIIMTVIIIFLKGLNLGIDFKGGLNFEVRTNLSNEQILNVFQEINSDREIIVKKEIGSDVHTIRIELPTIPLDISSSEIPYSFCLFNRVRSELSINKSPIAPKASDILLSIGDAVLNIF